MNNSAKQAIQAIPTEESAVNRAIREIETNLTTLDETVAALHSKVGPIMSPDEQKGDSGSTTGGAKSNKAPGISSLTSILFGLANRVRDNDHAIREVIDRMEV